MTSQKGTGTIPLLDSLPITLEWMGALATNVLNEHTDQAGLCVACGSAWPCERVVLAEHNLAVI